MIQNNLNITEEIIHITKEQQKRKVNEVIIKIEQCQRNKNKIYKKIHTTGNQTALKSEQKKKKKKKKKTAMRLRLKMIDTKMYMKSKYDEDKCRLCKAETENTQHIYT